MILDACAGILTSLYFICFIVTGAYLNAKSRADKALQHILKCTKNNHKFNTGDILLMNYKSMATFPGFENIPFHCGMVYELNNDLYVIEATRFQHPYLTDYRWDKKQGGGVRIVKLSDLISSIDKFMVVRHLISGKINTEDLEHNLKNWARHLEFNPLVSHNMSILEMFAIGFGPAFPTLGKICGQFSSISQKNTRQVFCSEFIIKLLSRLGHINKNFVDHWSIAPVSFISELKLLDSLSSSSYKPLCWGPEQSVVCLNGR